MRRFRSDAGNQGGAAQEMSDVQEQGGAPDVARLIHFEGQRMVRDRLRKKEHAGHYRLGFSLDYRETRYQRHRSILQRFGVEARNGIEAGRIQIVVVI